MHPAVKVRTDDQMSWDEAFAVHREQLRFYLDYLVECECDQTILADVETEVRDRCVPDEFKFRFMARVLVRQVIQHVRECTGTQESFDLDLEDRAGSSRAMPVVQRLVYFLRDILEYSRRDTSLLIGISDLEADKILLMARRRIDMCEAPSTVTIESPDEVYFRWNFSQLHAR